MRCDEKTDEIVGNLFYEFLVGVSSVFVCCFELNSVINMVYSVVHVA